MGDENPRVMYGVIITVYVVDRETTTVRSLKRRENEGERFIERIAKTRGFDRRASLLSYIRQMRAESLKPDEVVEERSVDNESERPNPKKKRKRKWIRKMMSKFRLPFFRKYSRKNGPWRYCQFDPDDEEEEAKSKHYNFEFWKKLKHMVGGLSRGCVRRSRRNS